MSLDEHSRQAYLRAIGIQNYYPRFILPAAQAARLITLSQEDDPRRTGQAPAPLTPPVVAVAEEESAQTPLETGTAISTDTDEIRFRLTFIRVNADICALNLLPHAGVTEQLGAQHKRLFENLCDALGLERGEVKYGSRPFRWPFSEAEHLDKSQAGARAALATYLKQQASETPFRILWLLGEQVVPLLGTAASDNHGSQQSGKPILLFSRSLDEMLRMPALKRESWERLRQGLGSLDS